MSYSNDTKPSAGTNTNDTEASARLKWSQAHRTWAQSHFRWASSGATYTNDARGAGSYSNDVKPS